MNPGWLHSESPFHAGEIAIQERLGVRSRIEAQGRRVIRDYLTEQHREFYAQLPFLIAGTVDANDRPWASILVGEPGFLSTPDNRTLQVTTQPLFGDPLTQTLVGGAYRVRALATVRNIFKLAPLVERMTLEILLDRSR